MLQISYSNTASYQSKTHKYKAPGFINNTRVLTQTFKFKSG